MRVVIKVLKRLALILIVAYCLFKLERYINRPYVGHYRSTGYVAENGSYIDTKIIHQSWRTAEVPKPELTLSWKKVNPNHTYHFMIDSEISGYVEKRFPKVYPLFKKFPQEIMRIDLLRYLLVYDQGGVYSDVDTECVKPIEKWSYGIKEPINFIINIEFDASDVRVPYFEETQMQFVQWTFAGSPRHPLLAHVITTIVNKFKDMPDKDIARLKTHDVTGPTIWSDAIKDYFCQLNFCNWRRLQGIEEPVLINDVLVLPPTSFQPYTPFRGKGRDHPLSFVCHFFLGSWKKNEEKLIHKK